LANSIALGAILGEHFGFPGQEVGTILYHNGTDWVVLDPPNSDGRYKLRLDVSGAGTTKVPSWQKGGLLNTWQIAASNSSVITLTDTITSASDANMVDSEGTEILSKTFTLSANVAAVKIRVRAYIGMADDTIGRLGLFRSGTTEAIKEDYAYQPNTTASVNQLWPMAINHEYTTTSPGTVTFTVRIATSKTNSKLNALANGNQISAGNLASTLYIEELGTNVA